MTYHSINAIRALRMSQLVSIKPDKLIKGLFVKKALGLQSDNTLFPPEGLLAESEEQISFYKENAETLFIDLEKSKPSLIDYCLKLQDPLGQKNTFSIVGEENRITIQAPRTPIFNFSLPPNKISQRKEKKRAQKLHKNLIAELKEVYSKILQNKQVELENLTNLAKEAITSITNNKDALMLASRSSQSSSQSENLAIRVCIWNILLGFSLEKSPQALLNYALTGLLLPVNYDALTLPIIQKGIRKSKDEKEILNALISRTIFPVRPALKSKAQVIAGIASHLEDWGNPSSGYPCKTTGKSIPLTAQISSISLYYELLQSSLFNPKALSPIQALKHLNLLRGLKFSDQMVDRFNFVIHIYPTGTMVRLDSKEIARVVSQGDRNKLKPNLEIVLDKNGRRIKKKTLISLSESKEHRRTQAFLSLQDEVNIKAIGPNLSGKKHTYFKS